MLGSFCAGRAKGVNVHAVERKLQLRGQLKCLKKLLNITHDSVSHVQQQHRAILLMRTKSRAVKVGYCGEDEHLQRKTNKIFPMV